MTANDREKGCPVLRIHRIDVPGVDIVSPGETRSDIGRRVHLADEPVGDEIARELDLRRHDRLRSHHGHHLLAFRQRGELLGFRQAISKRPFAVDVLAALENFGDQIEVVRHLDCHHHDIDVRGRDEALHAVICAPQTQGSYRRLSARLVCICDAD
ncbi:MAG: hypothetical protein WAL59_16790, partial [Roseiarcus sp.]